MKYSAAGIKWFTSLRGEGFFKEFKDETIKIIPYTEDSYSLNIIYTQHLGDIVNEKFSGINQMI